MSALQIVFFCLGAFILAPSARVEHRARALALIFLISAAAFSRRLGTLAIGQLNWSVAWIPLLPIEAFLPVASWALFNELPRVGHSGSRVGQLALFACVLGAVAFLSSAVLEITHVLALPESIRRENEGSAYWLFVFVLTGSSIVYSLARLPMAQPEERRRAAAFLLGLTACAAPAVAYAIVLISRPDLRALAESSGFDAAFMPLVQLGIALIPFVAYWAVAVDEIVEAGALGGPLRRYTVAQLAVHAGVLGPFLTAGGLVFEARRLPLDSILSGYRLWFVLLLVGAGVAVFVGRSRIQKLLDRKFHRDRPDAHRVIAEVVAENRRSSVPAEIGARLELQIERALRPTRVDVITLSQAGDLENSRMTIPRGRALASLTAAISDLPVDVDSTPELQDALSLSSAGAGAFRSGMAVPVRASDNRILGLLLLGRRRSEVAYSPEDRLLLSTIANAVGPSLEMRLLEGRAASPAEPEGAYECPECSRVFGPIGACGGCACVLAAAPVPLVLANKFEIEARLGAGSMGIVYQALDSQLGRRVAVKTLPRLDPESVVRLRTEARMMAAAAHPNVAIVFGLETWRGTPMLIVELLGRSTLADRIAHGGAMEAPRVGEIGIALSDALARAHGLGVLHRDIKPQNVGFSGGGDPKLMDFGLARIVADGSGSARAVHTEQSLRSSRATQGLVGTPLYLSPEALRGEPPDVSFDLWSLSITLYEAVTGTLPVERRGWAESARAILNASIRPASEVSDCPPSLSKALADFLSGDRTRRPASADQMRQRLRDAVAEM